MNERIRQLAEQAGCKVMDGEWYIPSAIGLEKIVYTNGMGLEKFAELIVKEMLQTCEDHPAWTGRMIGEQIKQHFGVEE